MDGGRIPLRVLVIEDNRDLADTLCMMLELLGHRAVAAHDGPRGIARAREDRPDIVFCDIGLPGMNGFDVAREMRRTEELSAVYLVALSGYAQSQDIQRALEAGFDCHAAKPVDMAALRRVLCESGEARAGR